MPKPGWLGQFVCLALLVLTVQAGAPAQQPGETTPDDDTSPRAPLPPPGYMDASLGLIRQGRYAEARKMLEPVVANHPGWARAHFFLALTYHKEHRYEAARELYERVLRLDPDYDVPRLYFGWCLYYLGELEAARSMFESFLAAKPGYPDAIFALGLIDFDDDDVEAARGRFEEVIRLARADADAATEAKARARLADVLVRTADVAGAKRELERSVQLNPENYETYFKLSRVLQRLGDVEGAARARDTHDQIRLRKHGAPSGMGQDPP